MVNNQARIEMISARLHAALQPEELQIEDESHLHAGHAGAKEGKGHFRVLLRAYQFEGLPPLKRHRLVYEALGELMETDIHALSIEALLPRQS